MDPRFAEYDIVSKDGCVAVGIEAYPPYTTYDGDKFGGFCINVLNIIMAKLGLCYSLIKSPNGLWGTRLENGSWTGLLGQAQKKTVEIISCPVAQTYQRFKVLDFAVDITVTDYSIVYARPGVKPNLLGFVKPYTSQTWFLILGATLIVATLTVCLEKYALPGREDENPDRKAKTFRLSPFWACRALLEQSVTSDPNGIGGRVFVSLWLLLTLVLAETYKSNLKALLIVPQVIFPFDDLEGLVNQNSMKWSFLDESIIPLYFKPAYEENPNSVMGKGWAKRGELYKNSKDVLEYVTDKKMACIEVTGKIYQVMSEDFSKTGECRLAVASHGMISIPWSYASRKKSVVLEWMNPIIMRLREAGILRKFVDDLSSNATYCTKFRAIDIALQLRVLEIQDFIGIFFFLFAGWFLATAAFVCELLINKYRDRSEEQNLKSRTTSSQQTLAKDNFTEC